MIIVSALMIPSLIPIRVSWQKWYTVTSCIVSGSFMKYVSVLYMPISFICSHLNSLCRPIGPSALPNFSHLFILWTCLLWLVGGWLGLGLLGSVLGDAVEQEYTNQDTSYEHYYHSSRNCNPHSGTSCEGHCGTYVKGRGLEL